MSYPPRPPMSSGMGMPHIMPPGYGYPPPPMGMMPMRMMPMMRPPMMSGPNPYRFPPTHRPPFPNDTYRPPQHNGKDKPPVTTVFVGNISDKGPDSMIRQMLQRCGTVLSWKRVQGASGKLQAFGFCEFESPEATMRCVRLLNEWLICDKKLVVKVDAKTKAVLDEYKAKKEEKKKAQLTGKDPAQGADNKDDDEPEEGETKESDDEADPSKQVEDGSSQPEVLDELTLREDRITRGTLEAVMKEFSAEIQKNVQKQEELEGKKPSNKVERYDEGPKDSTLDDMEIDDMKKDLINKEIRSFRDANKKNDRDYEEDKERRRRRDEDRDRRERDREKERERERERERREREREKEREREAEREQERRERERAKEAERERRERSRATRSRSKSGDRDDDDLDEEEVYEARKIERKLREKEAHYQDLLTQWEARERKKCREYEKEEEREDERKSDEVKEARRLKEFLEDYDDERDDPKYYKGSALQRRMKEREKEMEADTRDRNKEKEEIEEIRKKLLEEGSEDVEAEIARLESEKDAHLMPRLNRTPSRSPSPQRRRAASSRSRSPSPPPDFKPGFKPVAEATLLPLAAQQQPGFVASDEEMKQPVYKPMSPAEPSPVNNYESPKPAFSAVKQESPSSHSPEQFGGKRKKLTVGDVFNQDDDTGDGPKKRKLIPLDYEEEKKVKPIVMPAMKPATAEEKRKCIKNLIEKIPTGKDELFAYPLDWTMVDRGLMDKRIRPWVNKKILEYIGDEEPTLSDFICQKVMTHSAPASILSEIAMVFDEEAEVFVVKMWRLLIYETEAKKLGLVK